MSTLIEAISKFITFNDYYGFWWGVLAAVIVVLYFFRQKNDEARLKELSEEDQLKIQYRKDNIETMGCLIGGIGALCISLFMVYMLIWGN